MVGKLVPMMALLVVSIGAGWTIADRWWSREWRGDLDEAAPLRDRYRIDVATEKTPTEESSPTVGRSIEFDDAAVRSGIDFVYDDGADGKFHLMETIGGGMAVFDYDLDGRLDVFFPNGCTLPQEADRTRGAALYRCFPDDRDLQDRRYREVAAAAGVALNIYGQGAAAADFDHDGFDDLLATGFGALQLHRNNGDGTFGEHPLPKKQIDAVSKWFTSAVWFDADRDGNLDVYICAYAEVDPANPKDCKRGDVRLHCHPSAYLPQADLCLRNVGDGRFDDATESWGFADRTGRGLGVAAADFTGDGETDLYVANDTSEAFFWVNRPWEKTRFANRAPELGVSLSGSGSTMAGMGVGVADYDRNGRLDLFVTDFFEAGASLFANFGEQGFIPTSAATGLLAPTRRRLGFGTAFLDADLDGWPDLVAVNGHVSDFSSLGIPYKMKAQCFHNKDGRRFDDRSNSAGEFFRKPLLGRGLATADFNDDGRPDFVVSNIRDRASLLINRTNVVGDWIGFAYVGTRSAKGVRNVRLTLKLNGKEERFELHSGGGFLSSSDARLSIGLGAPKAPIDEVEVVWPSGVRQRLQKPTVGRYHLLVEPMDATQ